jgi:hypothetical protein
MLDGLLWQYRLGSPIRHRLLVRDTYGWISNRSFWVQGSDRISSSYRTPGENYPASERVSFALRSVSIAAN